MFEYILYTMPCKKKKKKGSSGYMAYIKLLPFTRMKLKGRDLGSAQEADLVFYNSFRASILGWKQTAALNFLQHGLFIISSPVLFYRQTPFIVIALPPFLLSTNF